LVKLPGGLGKQGRDLWRRITGDVADGWQLDQLELHNRFLTVLH
jgi:hypothetical protein